VQVAAKPKVFQTRIKLTSNVKLLCDALRLVLDRLSKDTAL